MGVRHLVIYKSIRFILMSSTHLQVKLIVRLDFRHHKQQTQYAGEKAGKIARASLDPSLYAC
jgi:hypothetical protein